MHMGISKKSIVLLGCLLLLSCKHNDSSQPYIKVFKYDDSVQCESSGVAPEIMMLELINAGIDVICSQKGHDGLARVAVCGADTGNINVYTIHTANLPDAQSLDFMPVSSLSDYHDQPCE